VVFRPLPVLVLLAALGAVAALPAFAGGDGPVFFEEPDPITRRALESALDDLRGNSITDHARGRKSLADIGYWAVAPLHRLLRTGSSIEKRNAALALGVIRDPRSLPTLLSSAHMDRHHYVPAFSALVIGPFRERSSIPALDEMLKDQSREDRRIGAVLSLAKIRDEKCFDILVRTAKSDTGDRTRRASLFCLGFFREQALIVVDGVHRPIPIIEKSLRSSNERIRRAALLAVALLGHRDLRPFYERPVTGTREGDPRIQKLGLLAMARFPDSKVTDLLIRKLTDLRAPGEVKVMVALLLMDRKDPAARDRLLKLRPREHELRAAVTLALSNFEDEEVVKEILRRLTDHKSQVRAAAAIAIARFTDEKHRKMAISHLSGILAGKAGAIDPDVKANMIRARRILSGEEPSGEFRHLGNREYVEGMTKDLEEKVLDMVNREAREVLGVEGLTPLRAAHVKGRFRVDDSMSELRDLKDHLDRHPYFEPSDIPEPKLVITPRRVPPEGEKKTGAGPPRVDDGNGGK